MKTKAMILNIILGLVLVGTVFGGESYVELKKAGQKNWIGEDYYFTYEFDKKPQLGTVILKIQAFTQAGVQDTSLKVTGDTGMPSMPGHHDTGEVAFRMNKKGDYLLPVSLVMPGDWQIKLVVQKDGAVLLRGSISFEI